MSPWHSEVHERGVAIKRLRNVAPTLVLHCRSDATVPFDEGRKKAAMIPGARFVALEGRNHLILEDEPAWGRFSEEVRSFLESGDRADARAQG